jgi:dienelactone hydrolase
MAMRKSIVLASVLFAAMATALVAAETFVTVETVPIQTTTMTWPQLLSDGQNGKPATIAGELRIPGAFDATDKLPAVIIAPGIAGSVTPIEAWAQKFNDMGVATFMIDYFAGRGLKFADRYSFPIMNGTADAYRALALLAKHPRIDPNRIAIMGISWGGTPALYSSLERFDKIYGQSPTQFAAHIVFYPGCSLSYREGTKTTGKPIRIFHGIADDWTPIGPCRDYVKQLKGAGADVVLTEFPDAYHAFDWPNLATSVPFPEALSVRACSIEEGDNGAILNAKTGKAFSMQDACVEKGTHLGYNAAAYKATVEGVTQFLKTKFKLQ